VQPADRSTFVGQGYRPDEPYQDASRLLHNNLYDTIRKGYMHDRVNRFEAFNVYDYSI